MNRSFWSFCFLFLVVLFLAGNIACRKEKLFVSNATIVGLDGRMCMCCGGFILTIDKKPIKEGLEYATDGFPDDFQVTSFPMRVNISWQPEEGTCSTNRIKILKIKSIKE